MKARTRRYTVTGQVFFASADAFVAALRFPRSARTRRHRRLRTRTSGISRAVGALDKVVLKFRREGTEVEIVGLNEASATLVDRLGVHDKPDAEHLMGDTETT